VYFITPRRFRNWPIFIFSIFFYAWGEQLIVGVMLASTVIDYFAAHIIEKSKRQLGLIISICSNLGFLFYFKYANFAFHNYLSFCKFLNIESASILSLPKIALPIGISFYTFQTLSYTIDVFRGNTKANRSFIDFACYVTMFPQLVAGPIVRYTDIQKELKERNHSTKKISVGIERFIVGLAKKVLIANTFAFIVDDIFSIPFYALSTELAWLGIISYSIQIYYDFSGYSDMAIGLALIMGFHIPENFNYPYISKSIKEFWRRWHISLSKWFRDYLYISLGGNRISNSRTYINLFIVFFITGLWHGASWNFVVWGLFHGLFLVIERIGFDRILERCWSPIQHLYTLLIVIIGWVFFRADDIHHALSYLKLMFTIDLNKNSIISIYNYLNYEVYFFLALAMLFASPLYKHYREYINEKNSLTINLHKSTLIIMFFISVVYVTSSAYNPFIYFRF